MDYFILDSLRSFGFPSTGDVIDDIEDEATVVALQTLIDLCDPTVANASTRLDAADSILRHIYEG